MSGHPRLSRLYNFCFLLAGISACIVLAGSVTITQAQQRREREPNSVYTERRAKLVAHLDGPVVLWGFSGREESSQSYIFAQEDNFYYLTGHNEEGAGFILLPPAKPGATDSWEGPREIFFLPPKDPAKEKWNGLRMSPSDPGIEARTGFAAVKPFPEMRSYVEKIAKIYPSFWTILPYEKENGGYPHEKAVCDWLQLAAPQIKLKDIRAEVGALRQVKSPGEVAFLRQAIDLSLDAHFEAMKMMRPGLFEYQVAARMVEIHEMGGSESEGYAPIVGAGPNSTALHYDKLSRKIQEGDIVVLDVGAQYAGYSADITRTLPANGKFTPRQREIYDIVLGAQNAVMAALKPGIDMCNKGSKSVYRISFDYIDSHGKDLHGKSLGQYYIHGLGHNIGLDVHDPGGNCKPLEPGQVVTVEPGIYIPEENLGVRIEDDVLITDSGYKLLSERLPRDPDEIERIMGDAIAQRAKKGNQENCAAAADEDAGIRNTGNSAAPSDVTSDVSQIKALVAKYAESIDGVDTNLAARVWWNSPEVSFIYPLGHEHGFDQIKSDIYEKVMGGLFSERHLSPRDIAVHVYGDSAVVEFDWDFAAKMKKDDSPVATHGRETQIYERKQKAWRLVHVHYSEMPRAAAVGQ